MGDPAPLPEQSKAAPATSALGQTLHLPVNPEAERAVLGAILADANCFFRVVDRLRAEDFHNAAHRTLFAAFSQLAATNQTIDLVSTIDQLERTGNLDAAGGRLYLANLTSQLPDPANVEYYADIVRDRAVKRELVGVSQQLLALSARDEGEAAEALEAAEAAIIAVAQRTLQGSLRRAGEVAKEELGRIESISKAGLAYTGISTGFYKLDELTSGLQKQDLIILAARPGVGKTAMALNIAAHCAIRQRLHVAIFSLEMSASALVRRLLAAEARINLRKLTRGVLSRTPVSGSGKEADWTILADAADRLAEADLWIDDSAVLSPMELRGKCRRLAMERGLDLVVVDYLQLMTAGVPTENRTQEVSAISRGLKAVAKQLNVPVLALSQLSRYSERRGGDQRPQLSDLRESGSIEQDADVVLFINRKNPALASEDESREELRQAEVIVAKQRNGPTDLFRLLYLDEYTRFENMDFVHNEQ
ncbi:MAG: replicative DNA helicase [Thermoanaerobaculaceae bacterium]|jgi:replicative DNA helicase|nr:replicative DNA helicase [Thermoanaerobaculaceae bacterium]